MKRAAWTLGLCAAWAIACGGGAETKPPSKPPVVLPPPRPVEAAPKTTPDAPFRQEAPKPDGKLGFVAPTFTEATLKNGLRVLLTERHELPIVSLRLVLSLGAGDVPDTRPGAISFLGAMLEQGTKKRTALQIDDEYEALGATHGASFDWDSGVVSVKVLSSKLDAALELMSDVALNPSFPAAEVERLRARRIAAIQSEKSNPGTVAQNALVAALFGRPHPYGHSLSGEEIDAKKLTRADVTRLYGLMFVPKNAAIVVAGDIARDALLSKLEATFGGWKNAPGAITRRPPAAAKKVAATKRIVLVDKPGAQSQVQVVRPGVPYATKDRDALVVMNAIFGGMFSSRINLNLREKHAFTYGARSHFAMRHGAGPFSVGAAVFADKTVPAIKEILTELSALGQGGPTEDELSLAKESMILALPGRFETVADVTQAMAELVTHDLPLDHYATLPARIEAVTAADVKRHAAEFLVPGAVTVVVVGDKAKLAPRLEELGLGDFEERDAYGNVVSAKP